MWKKKGSYSDVFKGVMEQLFCLKLNLEFGHQSYREIALQNIFNRGYKHLAPGNSKVENQMAKQH
jgi:hypothetical protein